MNEHAVQGPKRQSSEFVRFVVVDRNGVTYEVTADNFDRCPIFAGAGGGYEYLRQFVANELAARQPGDAAPKHIELHAGATTWWTTARCPRRGTTSGIPRGC